MEPSRHDGGTGALAGLVAVDAQACLRAAGQMPVREGCVEACPSASLSWRGTDPVADANCTGCGLCAAACPNDALDVAGFALTALPRGAEIPVTCSRDRSFQPGQAIILPCLGGVTVTFWLEMCDTADRKLVVLDRGWCATCQAGGGEAAPWSAALAEVRQLLGFAGWPDTKFPSIEMQPLPSAEARPLTRLGVGPSRRALFTVPTSTPAKHSKRRHVSARRRRVEHVWLSRMAARSGRGSVTEALPMIAINESCRDHGICAALCPTGALERWQGPNERGLAFDAMKCLACGRCAEACPSQALKVFRHGARITGRTLITRRASATCSRCAAQFAAEASDGEHLCPTCTKRQSLGAAALSLRSTEVRG